MKIIATTIISTTLAIALTNCAAPAGPNTQRGAATGALLGAAAGGIIGHQSGRGLEGAAIGAAAGGGAGALYGNARDQEQYNNGYDNRRY
jgi:5'-3' exoribonuclease 2